jgi:hypothetical protein
MSKAQNTDGKCEMHIQNFGWKFHACGRIISKWILNNCRLDLVGTEKGPVAGHCECGNAACGLMQNWRKQRMIKTGVLFIEIYGLCTIVWPFCLSITSLSHRASRLKLWYFYICIWKVLSQNLLLYWHLSGKTPALYPTLGHNCFLPHHYHFTVYEAHNYWMLHISD